MICSGAALSNRVSQSRARHARPVGPQPSRGVCFGGSLWERAGGGVGADTPGASSAVESACAIVCCGHPGIRPSHVNRAHNSGQGAAACTTPQLRVAGHCCPHGPRTRGCKASTRLLRAWQLLRGPSPTRKLFDGKTLTSFPSCVTQRVRCFRAALAPCRDHAAEPASLVNREGLGARNTVARCSVLARSSVRPGVPLARAGGLHSLLWLCCCVPLPRDVSPAGRATESSGKVLQMTGLPLPC